MTENLWKILDNVKEWIKVSESKAAILLTVQSVIIGLLSTSQSGQDSHPTCFQVALIAIAIILNGVSMAFAFLCLNPRLKLRGGKSPLYFQSIASFSNSEDYKLYYIKTMTEPDAQVKELCGQIYVNSEIARRKFFHAGVAIRAFSGAMLFWFLLILLRVVTIG